MASSTKPLQRFISDSFASAGTSEFLLPIKLDEVYEFISQQLIAAHVDVPPEALTLLVDDKTALDTNILIRLGSVPNIYVCGDRIKEDAAFPRQAQLIRDSSVETHDRFIILISATMAYLLIQGPSPSDINDLQGRPGFWSFHRESIIEVAQFLTGSGTLKISEQRQGDTSYPVSNEAMNLLSQLGNFVESQQQNAVVLKNDFSLILDILNSLSVLRSTHEILYLFVEKIAATVHTDRCSVVRIWEGETGGHVLASHEDVSVNNMVIDLNKYPEILNTLETKEKTLINELESSEILCDVAPQLQEMGVTAILVIPIVLFDPQVGTFLLRVFRKGGTFTKREVDFCQIVSKTAAKAIERADLFETIQKANRSLERLATTDALTGLYNRRYFISSLDDEISRSVRHKIPLACMLIDIDNFKSINDSYGHLEGDDVLRDVSMRTLNSVRGTDTVARYGGEELIITLPQTNADGAIKHANRLLKTISERPYKGIPEDVAITVSIGISLHESTDPITSDEFIKKADLALYEAKRTGKNKLVVYSE